MGKVGGVKGSRQNSFPDDFIYLPVNVRGVAFPRNVYAYAKYEQQIIIWMALWNLAKV